jgi:hypothetical protein
MFNILFFESNDDQFEKFGIKKLKLSICEVFFPKKRHSYSVTKLKLMW